MTLVDVDGVDGSGCGWLDIEDVVVVAGVVAEVFVVGYCFSPYIGFGHSILQVSRV